MKLSNERILNDSTRLSQLSQKELPVKVSYAIAKNMVKLEVELKTYNSEREKLIEKYSQKDENGKTVIGENNQIKLQEDHLEDWKKDIKELLDIESDIDIHKFSVDTLEGFSMTPAEIMLIDYMIQD
jgi:sulfur relay (sulfurtransferase) DsrC/TusE family protein